eukprot:gb/GECH01012386.1/.p1 GENE.gb/GECH01012386.1/~~gb/GECH01012386.1/.p1  ORF type:complete len:234 (+),score=50.47 gb/GECH01012386.1/:1-702(+)
MKIGRQSIFGLLSISSLLVYILQVVISIVCLTVSTDIVGSTGTVKATGHGANFVVVAGGLGIIQSTLWIVLSLISKLWNSSIIPYLLYIVTNSIQSVLIFSAALVVGRAVDSMNVLNGVSAPHLWNFWLFTLIIANICQALSTIVGLFLNAPVIITWIRQLKLVCIEEQPEFLENNNNNDNDNNNGKDRTEEISSPKGKREEHRDHANGTQFNDGENQNNQNYYGSDYVDMRM